MVERYAEVQLSIGKVTLMGLMDADCEHEFLFVDNREPVMRSSRVILLNMKLEGRGLWQCLVMGRDWDLGRLLHEWGIMPCAQEEGAEYGEHLRWGT